MNDNRFVVKLDVPLNTKEELIHYVSSELVDADPLDLAGMMAEREAHGSIEIAEEVVLPHMESDLFEKSQILIIRPKEKIDWDDEISKVKLVIMVLLRKEETDEVKKEISQFMRKLADDDYLDALMRTDKTEM